LLPALGKRLEPDLCGRAAVEGGRGQIGQALVSEIRS
jgi:hypothetical protein